MHWFEVTTTLPGIGQPVWVLRDLEHLPVIARLTLKSQGGVESLAWDVNGGYLNPRYVSHWMPIPPRPSGASAVSESANAENNNGKA